MKGSAWRVACWSPAPGVHRHVRAPYLRDGKRSALAKNGWRPLGEAGNHALKIVSVQ